MASNNKKKYFERSTKPPDPLTSEQRMFIQTQYAQKKPLTYRDKNPNEILQELTKDREKNTLNITTGQNIAEYKEYLETRCNKLCLFKTRIDIKPFYKTKKDVKTYIDKNCDECTKILKEFNRALDTSIKRVLPGTDPSSPTVNFNIFSILIENGTAIFNYLPIKFKRDLKKFEPLDVGDIKSNEYSLLNQLEINIKDLIKREKLRHRRSILLRRSRNGGRKTKRRKKRKTKRRKKRKTKRKKRRRGNTKRRRRYLLA